VGAEDALYFFPLFEISGDKVDFSRRRDHFE
jgi:hypothetical protein